MHGLRRRKKLKLLELVVLIVFIDQLSKFFVTHDLLAFMGGFLHESCNNNIAWSIPLEGAFFITAWLIAFSTIFYLAKRFFWNIFLVMVIAGAISNMIDRIYLGCVVDFISIGFFPLFNIADIFISVGTIFFIISIIKPK